jgi:hypothetical protein
MIVPRQLGAFLDPERFDSEPAATLRTTTSIGTDLDLADQLLAHVEAADEVGRHADRLSAREDVLGDAVVEHALAADRAALLRVERGRVVLEILMSVPGSGPS